MPLVEINFDGIVGPSHNYAGLSLGNLAATRSAGTVSHPRAAALEGLAKMRANMADGLCQGFFVPLARPNALWLKEIAADATTDPALLAGAWSASSMWTANAATVSPAPDTADGRCHLTIANLVTMPHRAHEWPGTLAQLRLAFADEAHFAVHPPVPPCPRARRAGGGGVRVWQARRPLPRAPARTGRPHHRPPPRADARAVHRTIGRSHRGGRVPQ
jgi:succinylarginine dihydrolase